MTDFVDDLERELVAAARRRRHRRLPRITARPILAFVAIAVAVAAIVLIARPASDERSVTEPPAHGATFKVPPAVLAKPCGDGQPPTGEPSPPEVAKELQLLRRAPTKADILPSLVKGGEAQRYGTWLPVGKLAITSARTPAGNPGLHVISTSDVRTAPLACAPTESRGPGACLIAGDPGQPISVRCFTLAEIRDGRAFMLLNSTEGGAELAGIVPDASPQVDLRFGPTHKVLVARENVIQQYVDGLTPGNAVTLRLAGPLPVVLVVNHTTVQGLATATGDQLRAKLRVQVFVDTGPPARNTTEVVANGKAAEPLAREVGKTLGAPVRIGPPPLSAAPPRPPDVTVHVGTDRTR